MSEEEGLRLHRAIDQARDVEDTFLPSLIARRGLAE